MCGEGRAAREKNIKTNTSPCRADRADTGTMTYSFCSTYCLAYFVSFSNRSISFDRPGHARWIKALTPELELLSVTLMATERLQRLMHWVENTLEGQWFACLKGFGGI